MTEQVREENDKCVVELGGEIDYDRAPALRGLLLDCVARGRHARPRWEWQPKDVDRSIWQDLERARRIADQTEAPNLYLPRLEELEIELLLLESLGQTKQVRPMDISGNRGG